MVDTVRLQWSSVRLDTEFEAFIEGHYPSAMEHRGKFDRETPWVGTSFSDGILGTCGTKSSARGTVLWVERSLPKFLTGDNCKQLTLAEAREGLDMLQTAVEVQFGEFLPKQSREVVKLQRVDFYHQRPMPSAAEVFSHIGRCLSKQKGVATHLYGVEVHQSREIHGRFYDKGIESNQEQYVGVVRHEEQLRGAAARKLLDIQSLRVDPESVRAHMNRRFEGWPAEVECYGYEELIKEHKQQGAAAIALREVPQLDEVFKRCFSKTFYYAVRGLQLEAQRRMFKLDLRVPDNAWQEVVVL